MSMVRDQVVAEDSFFIKTRDLVHKSPTEVFVRSILAGGITGALNISLVYPTEFVKTQLQLDQGKIKLYTGSKDVLMKTLDRRGFLGLYKGCNILIFGSIPMYGVRFGFFDALKRQFGDKNGNLSLGGR